MISESIVKPDLELAWRQFVDCTRNLPIKWGPRPHASTVTIDDDAEFDARRRIFVTDVKRFLDRGEQIANPHSKAKKLLNAWALFRAVNKHRNVMWYFSKFANVTVRKLVEFHDHDTAAMPFTENWLRILFEADFEKPTNPRKPVITANMSLAVAQQLCALPDFSTSDALVNELATMERDPATFLGSDQPKHSVPSKSVQLGPTHPPCPRCQRPTKPPSAEMIRRSKIIQDQFTVNDCYTCHRRAAVVVNDDCGHVTWCSSCVEVFAQ